MFCDNQPLGQRLHLVLLAGELTDQEAIQSDECFEPFLEECAQGLYPVLGERQGLAGGDAMVRTVYLWSVVSSTRARTSSACSQPLMAYPSHSLALRKHSLES